MRSLLAKSSVTILIILALGSGLTLAATSSEPGMFLYPIKQRTQKFTGATGSPAKSLPPVIEVPQGGTGQLPSANVDIPSEETQKDGAENPEVTGAGQANETTATPVPTPVRVVDEITVNTEPDAVTGGGSVTIDDASGPPAIDQLGSGDVDDGRNDDGQPEESKVGDVDDGQAGKKDKSSDNDNDSNHDDESHDDEEDKDD